MTPFRLGLTGSIGMGKSTTAKLFADAGCAVWDADSAVHRLYEKGGAAVSPMAEAFPESIVDGAISREKLKEAIASNPTALKTIEHIVHPLMWQDRSAFVEATQSDILVFDIPILFETGGDTKMDAVVVVSAPADVQKARVLARPNMTQAQFEMILSKQIPDAEKRARADYLIITDTLEHAATQVQDVVADIREKISNA